MLTKSPRKGNTKRNDAAPMRRKSNRAKVAVVKTDKPNLKAGSYTAKIDGKTYECRAFVDLIRLVAAEDQTITLDSVASMTRGYGKPVGVSVFRSFRVL